MRALPVAAVLLALSAGCDHWPLHANLPDPWEGEDRPLVLADVAEDTELADGAIQDIGAIAPPTTITVSGEADACGWDPDADWPEWPAHPIDLDGDGVDDAEQPWHAGWYAGDVDLFGLASDAEALLSATLSWENAPDGGVNAPFQPGQPGPWEDESDLDVVLFDRVANAPAAILREGGFSRAHPEDVGPALLLASDAPVVLSVGCHHGQPSRYTLVVALSTR